MILIAILSVVSAVCGLVGGHKWRCCLDAFLALHGINTLCQLILVIILFSDFQGVVDAIDPKETGKCMPLGSYSLGCWAAVVSIDKKEVQALK